MPSKQGKTKKSSTGSKSYKSKGLSGQSGNLLKCSLYGIMGALIYYFIHPVLAFNASGSPAPTIVMMIGTGALAFAGATTFFEKNVRTFAFVSAPLALLHVLVNLLLTYAWIEPSPLLNNFASLLTIPLGILVFFVLLHTPTDALPQAPEGGYPIANVFQSVWLKVAALLVLIIAGVLIFYRLGYYDIWEDENLVINAAVGVYEQGFDYLRDGYDRAWLHTIICAGVFDLFGVSEFSGRLPSAVFGVLFVIISIYVFARWYGLAWLAILVPLICLMNDRFLILFRYMRMYALLIPLFLASTYILYMTISRLSSGSFASASKRDKMHLAISAGVSLLLLPLLAHVHKLSMIVLPVFGLFILYLVFIYRTRTHIRVLLAATGITVVLLFLTFVLELEALKLFRQVAGRIFSPHTPMTAYFEYVFENGLPRNSTIMFLLGGLGLLGSPIARPQKSLMVLNYLFILTALVSMVYLVGNTGRDYRYIAHIVPFVVSALLFILFYYGKALWKSSYPWTLLFVFLCAVGQLLNGYHKVYVRHPWAPRYSTVYETLESMYKPGDALFATNIKTYYLDPVALAGNQYHKVPKKKAYTLDQLKSEALAEGRGWFLWEWHKTHQLREELVQYIYKNFKPVHHQQADDLGLELFYFDSTMIR